MEFSKCLHENNQTQEVEIALCLPFVSWILLWYSNPPPPDNNGSAVAGVSEGYSLYQDAF